jgi:hypothetical protein
MDKKRISVIPGPDGEPIEGLDLDFYVIKEDYNIYQVEDGTKFRIKLVVGKISKGVDSENGDVVYLDTGEPYYNVRYSVLISQEVPEELQK